MLNALYFSGTAISLWLFATYLKPQMGVSLSTRFVIFSISIIPLGKLIYFPIPGFYGLKIPFLISALIGTLGMFLFKTRISSTRILIVALLPVISCIWLEDPTWFYLHDYYGGQTDSAGLRILVLVALLCYCIVVSDLLRRDPKLKQIFARAFISGTLYASFVGALIAQGVWMGEFTAEDIFPISVDTHIIDLAGGHFYRFNPGANVNEFSMIIAFSIILLKFAGYSKFKTNLLILLFLILELATLTRGSWVALLCAIAVAQLVKPNLLNKTPMMLLWSSVSILLISLLYISNPDIAYLIDSRTALDLGPSGIERLKFFGDVFSSVWESPFRLLFGFGWSTNLYVHNVYLQILYELGLLGLLGLLTALAALYIRVTYLEAGDDKAAVIGLLTFLCVAALTHHTLFHAQTWLMLAFVLGSLPTLKIRLRDKIS